MECFLLAKSLTIVHPETHTAYFIPFLIPYRHDANSTVSTFPQIHQKH